MKPNMTEIEKVINERLNQHAGIRDETEIANARQFYREFAEAITGEKFPEPERPIELRAGDVYKDDLHDPCVLFSTADGRWHIGGCQNGKNCWFAAFRFNGDPAPITSGDMVRYIRNKKLTRIGHIETKLIKD
jgi:hypothetical protein